MRILFDLRRVGLGNNGGSLTLVRSANALVNLGHEVHIIDSMKNNHKWTELKANHIIPKNVDSIPSADAVIATGYHSVGMTIQLPDRCGLKCHWIRGWETWQMPAHVIINKILSKRTFKIVNGIGLQNELQKYGFASEIIHPGYDLQNFYPIKGRRPGPFINLGGLHNNRHINIKRHNWVIDAANILKRKYKIKLFMYGTDKKASDSVDNYVRFPSEERKNRFYNHVDIWLAPTCQEGLHMPPAEAMLTECPVVGTNAPLSGMHDYLIHKETGLVSDDDFNSFLGCVTDMVSYEDKRLEYGRQARAKIMEIGSREKNMGDLVKLLETKI